MGGGDDEGSIGVGFARARHHDETHASRVQSLGKRDSRARERGVDGFSGDGAARAEECGGIV